MKNQKPKTIQLRGENVPRNVRQIIDDYKKEMNISTDTKAVLAIIECYKYEKHLRQISESRAKKYMNLQISMQQLIEDVLNQKP
jgi:hypothetical protein